MSQAIGPDPARARPAGPVLAFLGRHRWVLGLGLAVGAGLYLTSRTSYLLFHTLAELFSVVVAGSIFVIAWNARRFSQNGYLLWVGMTYLALGLLDLLHTLTYTGMTIIPGFPFAANQLWLAARALESLALLVGFAYLHWGRRPNPGLALLGFGAVTALILASIFVWRVFPQCFVAGQGQTRFKILGEYGVMAVLGLDALLLVQHRGHFHRDIFRPLLGATVLAILTEAAFTQYVNNYGPANLLGHLLKVCSYFLIYVAIVKHGVERPYEMVFKELDDANRRLTAEGEARRRSEERLEIRVVERTRMLRTLAAELVQSEHRERRRLAKVLHDHLQQLLVAAKWRAGALAGDSQDAPLVTACRQLVALLDEALQSSRDLATELSPGVLQEKGLTEALTWLARRMRERHALTVEILADPEQEPLPALLKEFLFDAVRELLFNVIKHAEVDRARIRILQWPGQFEVIVEDDGAGFDVEAAKADQDRSGLGLFSVQERLTHLGGWLDMASAPGRGSRFRLTVPLDEARGDQEALARLV